MGKSSIFERPVTLAVLVSLAVLGLTEGAWPSPNLARFKKAVQSSTWFGGDASRAVDGRRDLNYQKGSCTHTLWERSPWWSVFLGLVTRITDVTLYNRADCCGNRLADFDVIVTDVPYKMSKQRQLCGRFKGVAPLKVTIKCSQPVKGSFVTVVIPGSKKLLTLCEAEVYNNA